MQVDPGPPTASQPVEAFIECLTTQQEDVAAARSPPGQDATPSFDYSPDAARLAEQLQNTWSLDCPGSQLGHLVEFMAAEGGAS